MMLLRILFTVLLGVTLGGCDGASKSSGSHSTKLTPDQKKREVELIERLRSDRQPIFDLAITSARRYLATKIGDEEAAKATFVTYLDSLKTFGSEKWKVRGTVQATDEGGTIHQLRWEVTLQVILGNLQATEVKIPAK